MVTVCEHNKSQATNENCYSGKNYQQTDKKNNSTTYTIKAMIESKKKHEFGSVKVFCLRNFGVLSFSISVIISMTLHILPIQSRGSVVIILFIVFYFVYFFAIGCC